MAQPAPLKTFIIYARSDEAYKQQLLLHLRPLLTSRLLSVWHDGNILPGEDWEKAIKKELSSSDLVLVLVSAHSLNSEFIQTKELRTALDRLREGLARVVPVIVSPCGWKFDPVLAGLQALPLYASEGPKPVNDRVWQSTDEAWASVIDHLGDMVLEIQKQRSAAEREVKAQLAAEETARREAEIRQQREDLAPEAQRAKEAAERQQQEAAENEAIRQRAMQERERKWHEAHAAAWSAATEQHSVAAYEQFLSDYSHSAYAREARHRIKTLRQAERDPIDWGKWAGIGASVLVLAWVAVWMLDGSNTSNGPTSSQPTIQQNKSEAVTDSQNLTPSTEPPPPPAITIEKIGGLDYSMTRVEAGTYTMGSPATEVGRSDDECQHSVTVAEFSIGQTEVTQAQWKAVMGTNPSYFKGDNLPVESVDWDDVQVFIQKLNTLTGKKFRLPKEAEWEYAAREGGKNVRFGNGKDIADPKEMNFNGRNYKMPYSVVGEYRKTTTPVGTFSANALGLYDMSGNVWEWCQDKYGPYSGCSEPKYKTDFRVVRGGSWDFDPFNCRASRRPGFLTDLRSTYCCGLRLVL